MEAGLRQVARLYPGKQRSTSLGVVGNARKRLKGKRLAFSISITPSPQRQNTIEGLSKGAKRQRSKELQSRLTVLRGKRKLMKMLQGNRVACILVATGAKRFGMETALPQCITISI